MSKFTYAERWAVINADGTLDYRDIYETKREAQRFQQPTQRLQRVRIVPWRKAVNPGDGE